MPTMTALCAGQTDRFFLSRYRMGGVPTAPAREALMLCWRCDERGPCLESAMREEAGEPAQYRHGIRGGLCPLGRAQLEIVRRGDRHRAGHVPPLEMTG